MPRRHYLVSAFSILATALVVLAAISAREAGATPRAASHLPAGSRPEVSQAVAHAVSIPVREMPTPSQSGAVHRDRPLLLPPTAGQQTEQVDPVLQAASGPSISTTAGLNFAGVGNGDYGFTPNAAPPDTNGAAGATQYVQWVNESFAVFDKATGNLLKGPVAGNALFQNLGGACAAFNDGDPIAQYDKVSARWVLTQFAVSAQPYLQCVAVSQTADATGAYNLYAFSYGTQFPDYPKLGVWPDAYYITFNMFTNGQTFAGAEACAYDGAAMRAGAAAIQVCFSLSTSFGSLLPSDLDGATLPPAGSPNYLVNFGSNSLNAWKFHVDFATPSNSTFSGPTNIPVAAFTVPCRGGGTCIPQASTKNKLDSLADRLMYRLAYRNFGTSESLVVNHTVQVGSSSHNSTVGIRWYELRVSSGNLSVYQQGTFAPADGVFRWMGSIAMDKVGDIAVGYSASSSTLFPSIRYTGRVPTDALGTLEAENTILAGAGSQTNSLHRWGDYSALTVDPGDDCTFWYTNEYLKSSGSFNWSTRIASFKFPGCQ
jgi:hypothetical protein